MRKVRPFTEEEFYKVFEQQFKEKTIAFADIAPTKRILEEDLKPVIESADILFIGHFIGTETYSKCRNLYDNVIKKAEELIDSNSLVSK